uniref:Protein translocase subunit SecA n=1 Tax=Anthurium amnicola TaxID=1678845 RepID=A0A1D1XMH5_9ARAE
MEVLYRTPRPVAAAPSLRRRHRQHDRHLARSGTLVSFGRPSPRSPSSLSGGFAAPYLCRPMTALLPARPSSFSSSDLFTTFVPTPLPSRLRTPPPCRCCSALQAMITVFSPQVLYLFACVYLGTDSGRNLIAYLCFLPLGSPSLSTKVFVLKLFLFFGAAIHLLFDFCVAYSRFKKEEKEAAQRKAKEDMASFLDEYIENIRKDVERKQQKPKLTPEAERFFCIIYPYLSRMSKVN